MAQLDSASDSDSEGPRFESAWVGHKKRRSEAISHKDVRKHPMKKAD